MKFLTVFAAILAVAFGAHNSLWTLDQLSEAIENPTTNPSLLPFLEQALTTFMTAIFAGESHQHISIITPSVDLHTWTLSELSEAIENPNTNPVLLPYLENALNSLMNAIFAGEVQASSAQAAITMPALELSYWTLAEVDQALTDPTTSPALIPYLEQALNQMVENMFNGLPGSTFVLAVPLEVVTPTPVAPEVDVTPVQVAESPIAPVKPPVGPVDTPVAVNPAVPGSPLVQIILNINQKESAAPEAVINPTPVPESVLNPSPVILPSPPTPEVVVPDPVIIADYNPIDDVMISPPEINPIDLLHPVIQPAVVAGEVIDIGPM